MNYSFTGGDVGDATNGERGTASTPARRWPRPQSAQVFTETLRDLLQAQTPLNLARQDGDAQYSGAMSGYDVQPVSIQANETAALNRLTITVTVTYVNTLGAEEEQPNSPSPASRIITAPRTSVTVEERLVRTDQQTAGAGYLRPDIGQLVANGTGEQWNANGSNRTGAWTTLSGGTSGPIARPLKDLAERSPWFTGAQLLARCWLSSALGDVSFDAILLRTAAHATLAGSAVRPGGTRRRCLHPPPRRPCAIVEDHRPAPSGYRACAARNKPPGDLEPEATGC